MAERKTDFRPINGQSLCEYARLRFGWLRLRTNGCSVLAVYNALGLLGRKVSFQEIFGFFHSRFRPRFFGVMPHELGRFFRKYVPSVKGVRSAQELEKLLKGGGAAVVTVWNRAFRIFGKRIPNVFGGAHTMAVHYNGSYVVCNRYSNKTLFYAYDSPEAIWSEGCLIKGFYLKEEGEKRTVC